MKKQMTTSKSRTIPFRLLLAGLLFIGSTSLVQAQENVVPASAPNVKYVGIVDARYVFQVDFQNDAPEFTLEIKDQQGYQLFVDRFNTKKFRKQFAIEKGDFGDNAITFTFVSKGIIQKQVFDISTFSRVVEEVSVVKL
ncbi:MAG: hypothetical protein JWR72_3952 [Flavisolibacter sp.]|jgi:hypothetical protein|nr:hypothetical protein [Flavisolibacter sp.]